MSSKAVHTEIDGLDFIVTVPENTQEDAYQYGLIIGPPETLVDTLCTELHLPPEMARKLHQELYARGLITYDDVTRRRADVVGAITSVIKLDAGRIIDIYGGHNGSV